MLLLMIFITIFNFKPVINEARGTNNQPDLIVYSADVDKLRINPSEKVELTGIVYYEGTSTPPASGSSALRFDGTDYVKVSDSATLRNAGDDERTLSLWIYINSFDEASAAVIIRLGTTNNMFQLSINASNVIWCRGETATDGRSISTGFTYSDFAGSWQHIVVVTDGSYLRCYCNTVVSGGVWPLTGNWDDISVDLYYPGSTNRFDIIFDDIRIYNRALSADDVSELYTGTYTNKTSLILYHDLDGDCRDESGNSNHGTNYGAVWTDGYANIDVKVELGHMLMQSVSMINSSDGSFTIPITAENKVGQYNYNVYTTTDKNSVQNQTVEVIVDRFKVISISADDDRRDVGTVGTINVTINYKFDNTAVTTGFFTLNSLTLSHQGSGVWQTTDGKSSVQALTYGAVNGSGDTYGLTTVNMNNQSVTVIWDMLEVVFEASPDEWPYQGDAVVLNLVITRLYDGSLVTNFMMDLTKDGILWRDDLTTNSTTDVEEEAGSHTYNCSKIEDNMYGLTMWTSTPLAVSWEETGQPLPEPAVPIYMIYIDPMSLTLIFVAFTWVIIVLAVALILRR